MFCSWWNWLKNSGSKFVIVVGVEVRYSELSLFFDGGFEVIEISIYIVLY